MGMKKFIIFYFPSLSFHLWSVVVIFSFVFSNVVSAEVIGYDGVTTSDRAVKLKALTKGKFFAKGGRLVEFYLEGRRIGTTLSGGDGYALFEYLPISGGIKHLKVKAGADIDEGVLVVVDKNDRVLLLEIEGVLFESLFSLRPVKRSKETLQKLSKRFRIVYLTTTMGLKKSRRWLKDNGFPTSAVLQWKGADLLDELVGQGIMLYAIIGSPAVVSESSEHIKKRFSFEDTEDGLVVKDWKELLKRLR